LGYVVAEENMIKELPEIVAEIGINHNGSVELANEIAISCLTAASATEYPLDKIFIKFQKRCPEVSVPKDMWNVQRVSPVTGEVTSYIDYKKEIEFEYDDYVELNWLNDECGGWFVSVWDEPSAFFARDNFPGMPYIKIPSAHLTNQKLIKAAAFTDIPMVMSTGMSTQEEINISVDVATRWSDAVPTILACTATYPCVDEEVNFFKLEWLQNRGLAQYVMSRYRHGFSSHSPSPYPAIYSNFFDVDMIEVHVTTDRALPGSDQAASLEYSGFELLLRETIRISKLYGTGQFMFESEKIKREQLRGK
jgi:N-acetylneuraminate synthase